MKYRNTKTGNEIDVKSTFSGKDWEPVKAPASDKGKKEKPIKAPASDKGKKEKPIKAPASDGAEEDDVAPVQPKGRKTKAAGKAEDEEE